MAKSFLFMSLLFLLATQVNADENIITDPKLSTRCKEMLQKRNAKQNIKQRLKALLQKSMYLKKKAPKSKKIVNFFCMLSESHN